MPPARKAHQQRKAAFGQNCRRLLSNHRCGHESPYDSILISIVASANARPNVIGDSIYRLLQMDWSPQLAAMRLSTCLDATASRSADYGQFSKDIRTKHRVARYLQAMLQSIIAPRVDSPSMRLSAPVLSFPMYESDGLSSALHRPPVRDEMLSSRCRCLCEASLRWTERIGLRLRRYRVEVRCTPAGFGEAIGAASSSPSARPLSLSLSYNACECGSFGEGNLDVKIVSARW